uniref:Uncharacterized protein n=1 Tax=Ananas comosus var. bracteatus TaxID=296719 RepID=A0A6V7PUL2_ANACO|nr:unnamed protein product [Ananas comosus var. bracteatus]
MLTSDAAVSDIVLEPRATKYGKNKESRTLVRESASLEDRMNVLEDSIARAKKHYSVLSQHMGMMEEGLHTMEESVATAMGTFREQLEEFRRDLARREDERKVLVEDLLTRVDEVEDLKMWVTILEKAVARGIETQKERTPKIHIPEPQCFKGTRDEKEFDNFLWHMERYLKALLLEDEDDKAAYQQTRGSGLAFSWDVYRYGGPCTGRNPHSKYSARSAGIPLSKTDGLNFPKAKQLGLILEKDASRIKAVKSEPRLIAGVAKGVDIAIGPWRGKANLNVGPLDDFGVILGIDFLISSKAAYMPHLWVLRFLDESTPCMVPMCRGEPTKDQTLITLQLYEKVKCGKVEGLEENLSSGETDKSPVEPKQLAPK